MGYAEFLIQKMCEENCNPLTAYGCLVSVKSFGEHITCKVLTPYLKQIVENFRKRDSLVEIVRTNLDQI